jgi:hypothetical protein
MEGIMKHKKILIFSLVFVVAVFLSGQNKIIRKRQGAKLMTFPSGTTLTMDTGSIATFNGTTTIGTLALTTGNITTLNVGASGTKGIFTVYPTTALKGSFVIDVTDQTGNTAVTLNLNAHGQATVLNVADGGAAATYLVQSTAALSLAEADFLDGATAGTQVASKAVIADANVNTGVSKVTELHIGATGSEVQVNATALEINNVCDVSASTEIVTTTNVIAATESGKTFFLNSATAFVSTLPAPAAGLKFKFVITTQPTSGNHTVVTNAGANVIEGMCDVNSTLVLASNEDSINIVQNTAIIGDWFEVISDGTSWFVHGDSGAAGGITFTAT